MVSRDLCREKEILEQIPDKQTTEITVKLLAQGKFRIKETVRSFKHEVPILSL